MKRALTLMPEHDDVQPINMCVCGHRYRTHPEGQACVQKSCPCSRFASMVEFRWASAGDRTAYEVGYRDGESSREGDYQFAISEATSSDAFADYDYSPAKVAAYIKKLEEANVAQLKRCWDEARLVGYYDSSSGDWEGFLDEEGLSDERHEKT